MPVVFPDRKLDTERRSVNDPMRMAEGLIAQLPKTHDGRNTWLLNYGDSYLARAIRQRNGIEAKRKAANTPAERLQDAYAEFAGQISLLLTAGYFDDEGENGARAFIKAWDAGCVRIETPKE